MTRLRPTSGQPGRRTGKYLGTQCNIAMPPPLGHRGRPGMSMANAPRLTCDWSSSQIVRPMGPSDGMGLGYHMGGCTRKSTTPEPVRDVGRVGNRGVQILRSVYRPQSSACNELSDNSGTKNAIRAGNLSISGGGCAWPTHTHQAVLGARDYTSSKRESLSGRPGAISGCICHVPEIRGRRVWPALQLRGSTDWRARRA